MLKENHSRYPKEESNTDNIEHHKDNHRQKNRELGEVARLATPDEKKSSKQETVREKVEIVDLIPGHSYEIPAKSKISSHVAIQNIQQNNLQNVTELAQTALDGYDIMAIICIPDQHFWLLDVRDDKRFKDAKVPYLLIEANSPQDTQKDDSQAYFKGIRPGKTLQFGRKHNYNGRFDYSPSVSRDHFEVSCSDNGQVSIKDLYSTNGTSIIITYDSDESSHKSASDTGGNNLWPYTPSFERHNNTKRRGNQLFIILDNREYPMLDRDATAFNMSIDTDEWLPHILIDGDSPEIQEIYDDLKKSIMRRSERYESSITDKLKLVEKEVAKNMPYSKTEMEAITRSNFRTLLDGEKLIRLSDYVRGGYGVCRQQALLSACLLEKMKQDGLISGTIHVERNMRSRGGGHEWATFQETPDSSVYVIDVARRYVGKKEAAPDWDYRRP